MGKVAEMIRSLAAAILLAGMAVSAVAPTAAQAQGESRRYVVESGDTVVSIAMKQKVTLGDIYALNPNLNSRTMAAGDVLRLPSGGTSAAAPPPSSPPQPTVEAATPQPPPAVPQPTPAASEPSQGAPRSAVQAVPLPPPDVQTAAPEPPPLPNARPVPPVAQKAPPPPVRRQAAKPPPKPAPLVVRVTPPARVSPPAVRPVGPPVLATPVPPTGNPAISVNSAAGPSGTVIATAAGFPKFQRLKLFVGPSPADLHVAEWVFTDGNGWASTQTRVPARLQNDGVAYFQFRTLLGRVTSPVQLQQVAQAQRARPPAQAPVAVSIVGTISREGTQCRAMRGDDGRLYSLTGNVLLVMLPGLRVEVQGQVAPSSACKQGTTIAVSTMRRVR